MVNASEVIIFVFEVPPTSYDTMFTIFKLDFLLNKEKAEEIFKKKLRSEGYDSFHSAGLSLIDTKAFAAAGLFIKNTSSENSKPIILIGNRAAVKFRIETHSFADKVLPNDAFLKNFVKISMEKQNILDWKRGALITHENLAIILVQY